MINTILSTKASGYNIGPYLLAALALTLVAGIFFGAKYARNKLSSIPQVKKGEETADPKSSPKPSKSMNPKRRMRTEEIQPNDGLEAPESPEGKAPKR